MSVPAAHGGDEPIHACNHRSSLNRPQTSGGAMGTALARVPGSTVGFGAVAPQGNSGVGCQPAPHLCPIQCWTWPRAPPGFSTSVPSGPGLTGPLEEARTPLSLCSFPSSCSESDHSPLPLLLPCLWLLLSPTWAPALVSSPIPSPSLSSL